MLKCIIRSFCHKVIIKIHAKNVDLTNDTSATRATRMQHECNTIGKSATQVRYECYTNETSATRVKNFNFDNRTSKNIFSHTYIYLYLLTYYIY